MSLILPVVVSASIDQVQSDEAKSTSTADHGRFVVLQQEFKVAQLYLAR